MATLTSLLLLSCFLLYHVSTSSSYIPNIPKSPDALNKIDSCWRRSTESNWASNRKALADCAVGYGRDAIGGKYGAIYMVTDPSDDAVNPKPGTLRYAVIQKLPLWIIFERDMVITLNKELVMNGYKTIDGRGAKVEIANGPCITIQNVSHVIIHGISIHDCIPAKAGKVKSSFDHVGHRGSTDGDAISIFHSTNIWIDHCFFARCTDGLIDIIHSSTDITISNNYFTQHNKVMLLGHNDSYIDDKIMKVTIAFNHFDRGLIERMPRVRFGYAHLVNNKYDEWGMYAIGGSANPTILSEGNYFVAANGLHRKEVTKREGNLNGSSNWEWRSYNDKFLNGAHFAQSGYGSCAPNYTAAQSIVAVPATLVPALTRNAGPLSCVVGKAC